MGPGNLISGDLIQERFNDNVAYRTKVNSILSELKRQKESLFRDFNSKIDQIEETLIAIENYIASMCAGEMETDSLAESTFGYFLVMRKSKER